jgi:hypothetical protein
MSSRFLPIVYIWRKHLTHLIINLTSKIHSKISANSFLLFNEIVFFYSNRTCNGSLDFQRLPREFMKHADLQLLTADNNKVAATMRHCGLTFHDIDKYGNYQII